MNPTRTLIVNHLGRYAWLVAGGLMAARGLYADMVMLEHIRHRNMRRES